LILVLAVLPTDFFRFDKPTMWLAAAGILGHSAQILVGFASNAGATASFGAAMLWAIFCAPYLICANLSRRGSSPWPPRVACCAALTMDIWAAVAVQMSNNSTAAFGYLYGAILNLVLVLPISWFASRWVVRLWARRNSDG
jgi:hypothetical protein